MDHGGESRRDRELDQAIARVGDTAWRLLTGLPAYYGLFPGWRPRIDAVVAEVVRRRLRAPDPAGPGGIGLHTAAEEICMRIGTALGMDRSGGEFVMLGDELREAVASAVGGWLAAAHPVEQGRTPPPAPRAFPPGPAGPLPGPGPASR